MNDKEKIQKRLLETIDKTNKNTDSDRDYTYTCEVTNIYTNNPGTYELTYKSNTYVVKLNRITPQMHDVLHLMIPQGNLKEKFVLEDIKSGGGGQSEDTTSVSVQNFVWSNVNITDTVDTTTEIVTASAEITA